MGLGELSLWLGKLEYSGLVRLAARYVGARTRTASVDGLRMPYFERAGDGDPIVLVHGFGADKESWLLFMWALGRGSRLLVPDLPGHGGASVVNRGRATARAQSEALLGFLDLCGVDRFHLVGNSMGGGISLRVARDRPERVRSVVLLDATGPKVDPSALDLALDRGENLLIPTSPDQAEEMMAMVAEKKTWMPRSMLHHVVAERAAAAERLQEIFRGWQRGVGGEGVPEDLERISVPTLVVHGERDQVIDVSTARALAERIPGAELLVLAGVGHIPQVEVPRDTARAVLDFVSAH